MFFANFQIEKFLFVNNGLTDDRFSDNKYLIVEPCPRYLYLNDSSFSHREDFVLKVFDTVCRYPFQDDCTYAISRAFSDYDILLIDVTDPIRVSRFLRSNRLLLRSIAKFAITKVCSPLRRARILSAGFDDIFDISRMSPEEAKLRVAAVLQRRSMTQSIARRHVAIRAGLEQFVDTNTLTPREHALLAVLAENESRSVTVANFLRLVDHDDPAAFRRSLKVSISNLRRKLKESWRIDAVPSGGYRLRRIENIAAN